MICTAAFGDAGKFVVLDDQRKMMEETSQHSLAGSRIEEFK